MYQLICNMQSTRLLARPSQKTKSLKPDATIASGVQVSPSDTCLSSTMYLQLAAPRSTAIGILLPATFTNKTKPTTIECTLCGKEGSVHYTHTVKGVKLPSSCNLVDIAPSLSSTWAGSFNTMDDVSLALCFGRETASARQCTSCFLSLQLAACRKRCCLSSFVF